MYQKKTYMLESTIEVEEYHSARYGAPGMPRRKRSKPTPEQMARQNRWNREKKVRRQMRFYFKPEDYFSTLTYRVDERPADMGDASRDLSDFIRIVRREYKKQGAELRWMANIEVGTRGAWHIHLVMNRIPDTDVIIARAWTHGVSINKLLYQRGSFAELAAYMTKTPETDRRLRETRYTSSRNMPLPDPEIKLYRRPKTFTNRDIKVPKGWYLDKASIREGVNPVTGYPYRSYAMHKLDGGKTRCLS